MSGGRTFFRDAARQTTPLSLHRYRSVTLEYYRAAAAEWEWGGSASSAHTASFIFPLDGDAEVRVDDVRRARTGTVVVMHSARSASVVWDRPVTCVVVHVPMDALVEMGMRPSSLPWATRDSVLVRSARAFFASAIERPRDGSPLSAYLMEKLAVEMVFGVTLEQDAGSVRSESVVGTLERAQSTMIVRRGDPDFTPGVLARELHVSLRQLQREFAKAGLAPGAELRRLRVELAESLLRNPDYSPLSIPEIASFAGFGSASALRRAFADHGLAKPFRVRERAA